MHIALRVAVHTVAGALQGVPALLRLFDEFKIRASFVFSLGPDRTAHAWADMLPPWLVGRLPAPAISDRAGDTLRAVAAAGHEVGISAYAPGRWQNGVAFRGEEWTRRDVIAAVDRFQQIFSDRPRLYASWGWQINTHLLKLQEELGFNYASDVRGRYVFLPVLQGSCFQCPQIPATLPTLDGLLAGNDIPVDKLHEYLFAQCQRVLPHGELFPVSAEREGLALLPVLRRLIIMWQSTQYRIQAIEDSFEALGGTALARHQIGWGQTEGHAGYLAIQGLRLD